MQIADYTVQETLHQGKRFTVYRAIKKGTDTSCILKVLNTTQQGTPGIKAIENEYRLLTQIESEHIIKAYEQFRHNEYCLIVLEDIHGKALKAFLEKGAPFALSQFLELALSITDGLAAIHQHNIIHKDINPSNIIWNPDPSTALRLSSGQGSGQAIGTVKIIDFDIATQYDLKVSYLGNPARLEGTLPYISPEQTGRMNRRVDQRTDLYSLGVTFYEMLTGKRPFDFSDPMEMVHAHLAKIPVPPCELPGSAGVSPALPGEGPKILSDIIMKLLAKNPEDRYQSAEGLKYDLEQVQKATLTGFQTLSGFTPGTKDFSRKLQIPEKLYGRENEIKQLLEAYTRVTRGNCEMILVAGYSGTGKTVLVNEIHKPITRDRGYFISGKFDYLQRNIPYFAFIQAISQFCNLLLMEDEPVLAFWKQTILQAVGALGKVLTDIVPNLEPIIGKQPDVLQVGGTEAKNRFNYVFQHFIRAISTEEHPLVIFLDDLQWADHASLEILKLLMSDSQNQFFLFIGAYRDNEVSQAHPLMVVKEELQQQQVPMSTVPVKNLSNKDIRDWLEDTLRSPILRETQEITNLSDLLYRKTEGNAFFTVQFLTNLYKEQFVRFDASRSTWIWDRKHIEQLEMTENVVELLLHRIRSLPHAVREVLQLAACIGNTFDLETLSVIAEKEREIQDSLDIILREQLIFPLDEQHYKFTHDRFQQAAYALIPESDKKPVHLKTGRLLLKEFHIFEEAAPSKIFQEAEQDIFDLAKHFNLALDLMSEEAEKLTVARLNLRAAQKAKAATAYHPGWEYVQQALLLLPEDGWQHQYDLTLAIHNEAIQLAYLSSHYEDMLRLGKTVENFVVNVLDKATAYEYQIMGLIAQNEFLQAVDTALELLGSLGVTIPRTPGEQDMAIFAETKALLEKKGSEGLKVLPPMQDEEKQLAMRLYLRAATAIVFSAQELYPFIIHKMLLLSLQYGETPETAFILTEYGLLNVFMGDISGGYEYSLVASSLFRKHRGFESMEVRALILQCLYTLHWKIPYPDLAETFWELQQRAINGGDLENASYALVYYLLLQRYIGEDLAIAERKGENILNTIDQLKQPVVRMIAEIWFRVIEKLTGQSPDPTQLHVKVEDFLPVITEDSQRMKRFNRTASQLFLNCLFEHYEILDCADVFQQSPLLTGTIEYPNYIFYSTLLKLQVIKQAAPDEKQRLLAEVQEGLKQIQAWADFGPENFLHRQYLLQAELFSVNGNLYEAAEYYDKAIAKAHKFQFLCDEALSHELAAKFYQQKNRDDLAEFYFQKAWRCYRKWGATAKVKHLEEHYPKYVHPSTRRPGTTSSDTTDERLDVGSILKASQTLSGEVQLESLLEKMMQILIENAGAQKGVFIEQRGKQLLIQAEGTHDGVSGMLQALPVEETQNLPLAVINYVAHSKEALVFENITKEQNYSNDRYVQKHQPKSIVCFPVLKQSKLFGMIYLENNLVEGAFTPARLEVLNMLSAQIAISIENAELYETLEDRVRQRTLALQQAHEKLEKSHKNITDSVNYASRIQQAVLPTQELIAELFPEHFILYQPCAVVSGDFYWVKQLENTIVVAAVDCTGHGVSGALVSMLGTAFLNEIVPLLASQSQLTAGNILNELRTRVKIALKQTGKPGEQKEGMDIALCILDPTNNQLHYAGAYNPLYIIRDRQLFEVKADRMPIGIHRRERPFSSHDLPFQHGDMLYLFTDGFVDQAGEQEIGGFSKKRFQQLLLDIHHEPVSKQKELLLRRFEKWKGNLPQTDDMLIIGIRL